MHRYVLQFKSVTKFICKHVVSEPDPWKIGKEGLENGAGWKCTL